MEAIFKCGICLLSSNGSDVPNGHHPALRACASGCGIIGHPSCFPTDLTSDEPCSTFVCSTCSKRAPPANSGVVLARLAEITNFCIYQSTLIVGLANDLKTTSQELMHTKELVNDIGRLFMSKFGSNKTELVSELNSSSKSRSRDRTQSVQSFSSIVDANGGYRSSSATKRKDSAIFEKENETPNKKQRPNNSKMHLGVGSSENSSALIIPSVKKVIKKRIFVSRIAPQVELSVFATSVRTIASLPISVVMMKSKSSTTHNKFSSFVIYADESDYSTLMNPTTWSDGIMFKSFVGYLHPEQMDTRFDTDVTAQGTHIDGVPDLPTTGIFLRTQDA